MLTSYGNIITKFVFLIICAVFVPASACAQDGHELMTIAVAEGYPPYQFQSKEGKPVGLDVDIIMLVKNILNVDVRIIQGSWDDSIKALRMGMVDCVGGMEINEKRSTIFDFTTPCYSRKSTVFTLKGNSDIASLKDLTGRIIAGDRHSFTEEMFSRKGIKRHIRIYQPQSKDRSMLLLKEGIVVAMIAPRAVGLYLASKHGVVLKIIDDSDPGSPVGLAVIKGNTKLRDRLDGALDDLRRNGSLDAVLKKWQIK